MLHRPANLEYISFSDLINAAVARTCFYDYYYLIRIQNLQLLLIKNTPKHKLWKEKKCKLISGLVIP